MAKVEPLSGGVGCSGQKMPAEHSFSDDLVADLLKKDARESSIKYSALGLQAFLPKRYEPAPCPMKRARAQNVQA